MEYNKKLFINNVEYLLKENDMKISELENMCSLSQGYFARFKLLSDSSSPSLQLIVKLSEIFNVSINLILFNDCSLLNKKEKTLLSFIEKMTEDTFNDTICWTKYSLESDINDIKNSGISSLFTIKEKGFLLYKTNFGGTKYLDEKSALYSYQRNKDEFFVLCNLNKSFITTPDECIEFYYIKNNIIHNIVETNKHNSVISESLNLLLLSILREQSIYKFDDEVYKIISNY